MATARETLWQTRLAALLASGVRMRRSPGQRWPEADPAL
jgi:hypothetical protein